MDTSTALPQPAPRVFAAGDKVTFTRTRRTGNSFRIGTAKGTVVELLPNGLLAIRHGRKTVEAMPPGDVRHAAERPALTERLMEAFLGIETKPENIHA